MTFLLNAQILYCAEPPAHEEFKIPSVRVYKSETNHSVHKGTNRPLKRRKLNENQDVDAKHTLKLPLDKKLERTDIRVLIQNNTEKSRATALNALLEAAKNRETWVIAEIRRLLKSTHPAEHIFGVAYLASYIKLVKPKRLQQQNNPSYEKNFIIKMNSGIKKK